jgi:hypothetical protein
VDAKPIAAILITLVTAQCKVIVYAVTIANAQLTFAKKLLDKCPNTAKLYFYFLFLKSIILLFKAPRFH